MRDGEIVRTNANQIGRYEAIETNANLMGVVLGTVYQPEDLEIVTVAELFSIANNSVPDEATLVYYGGVWHAETDKCYWNFESVNGNPHRWWSHSHPLATRTFQGLPDLSRLPAIDAWDALPDVVKAVMP